MGCCGTKVDHAKSAAFMEDWRKSKAGSPFETLVMGIKDQNMTGKVYLSGPGTSDVSLREAVTRALSTSSSGVTMKNGGEGYDEMWDVAWHNTKLTSGWAGFSLTKPYFPKGKCVVALLDALAEQGWVPTAAPNFGGPISDKACVDWPSVIFGREDGTYTRETLFMAVKDQNNPGKTCVAGPAADMAKLQETLLERLKKLKSDTTLAFDSYDTKEDWDAVFQNTSITSGMQAFSMTKPYFPKGNVCCAMLGEIYALGWRLVAAPNFGGNDVSWPCFIFRKLVSPPAEPPKLVMGAVKDQNNPGKLCISAAAGNFSEAVAKEVGEAIRKALAEKAGQSKVKCEKDSYDDDWHEVVRNTNITNGLAFMGLSYFPKNKAMVSILNAMNENGWSLAAAPNFGGLNASWPCFVWEQKDVPVRSAFVAIKDQNYPGKVCLGGVGDDSGLQEALLAGFKAMSAENVTVGKDGFDSEFDTAFRNTKMTTGSTPFSMQNAWFPFGFPLELLITEMGQRGWRCVGGPNFGQGLLSWPAMCFENAGSATPVQAVMEGA